MILSVQSDFEQRRMTAVSSLTKRYPDVCMIISTMLSDTDNNCSSLTLYWAIFLNHFSYQSHRYENYG